MSQLVLKHPDLKHEDLKFNTVEVHAGEPRDMYGALIPPIYQTSTFYFDSTDDAVKACDDYAESFAYSRITNPSVDYLEQKLAALEHGKGAVAYASGMGAVSGDFRTAEKRRPRYFHQGQIFRHGGRDQRLAASLRDRPRYL